MGRFLIYFSYLGTRYSGVQRQNALIKGAPILTVEGALQAALQRLRPKNDFKIVLSSRTDSGVHAFKNSCHVDLTYPYGEKEYDPSFITDVANFYLKAKHEDVRVVETRQVPDSFHSRFMATGRKYVYRFAHAMTSNPVQNIKPKLEEFKKFKFRNKAGYPLRSMGDNVPFLELGKLLVVSQHIDIDMLMSAAEMLSGIHNFTSFSTNMSHNSYQPHPVKLLTIGVKRGQPLCTPLFHSKELEFWEIHVQSKSFLYRQVRRLVGAMMLVGKGKMTLEVLQDILENPQSNFDLSSQMSVSECGLYLLEVNYDPKVLELNSAEQSTATWNSTEEYESSDEDDAIVQVSEVNESPGS
ncbi:tRNA pseudouridine synthase-like 1 [Physella acuta]|uniref:tRNA pseudouridine synthase-like 1 n=1 Tax=Physella acuta TaxID=109671 RepID=UPI0027DDE665|nr:tRNA pseudouridine synthase-like 1 [Physella acuta]XP_059138764.1 tRNA pseudouridine synthase-like 1 [Physella acuta]XP_059138765.1 tRNA pseudouridine synthase-like 1 [Physella acuta]